LRAIIDGDERVAATLAAEHVMRAGADFMAGLDMIDEFPAGLVHEKAQHAELPLVSTVPEKNRIRSKKGKPTSSIS
jgi:hypothetical protein